MAVSHLILVSSIKASTLLAHRGVKDTVWEWDRAFSVFPESCPDHPGKYKRANPFQVESMTRDCHMNRCRPSPAPAGSAVGSGRRLYGEVFWEGLWIETYSWEAKVTLFITTSRGSWLPGSHSDLWGPFSPWNSCNSAGAFFLTWGQLFLIWQKQFDKTWWEIQFSPPPTTPFFP